MRYSVWHRQGPLTRLCVWATVSLGCASAPAHALIVQPAASSLPAGIPTAAVGRWGNNAAAVAVAPDWVLTTRHQDNLATPPNRNVVFNGTTYVADVANQVTFGGNIDLRLVRVTQVGGGTANLSDFVELYDSLATPLLQTAAITGHGPTRGAFNTDGYDWAGTLNNANPLNTGQNGVSQIAEVDGGSFDGMGVLVADFDDPAIPTSDVVAFEATGSFGDSGGGWFLNDAGTWKLVGLTHAVQIDGDDDFSAGTTDDDFVSQAFFTQQFLATDIRPFVGDINAAIPEPGSLALLAGAGLALVGRRRARPVL